MFANRFCCCCCGSKEVIEMQTSAHPSWTPGQFNASFIEETEVKQENNSTNHIENNEQSLEVITKAPTSPSVVSQAPTSPSIVSQAPPEITKSLESLHSIDVRLGLFEDERFKDMAPSIYKHHSIE